VAFLTLRKFVWLFLATLLGLAGWMGISYASASREWRKWKAAREAKGETFRWSELAPPPIPDERNAAMHPALQASIVGKEASPLLKRLDLGEDLVPSLNLWITGNKVVLPDPRSDQGRRLARALEARASEFDDLAAALSRPDFRIPVAYGEGETPTLLGFRAAFRALTARALIRLRRGEHAAAAEDAMVGLRLSSHLGREPSLMAHLLSTAVVGISMQVIWEGLVDHAWTEPELAQIEAHLARVDLLASGHLAFQGERMLPVMTLEAMAEGRPLPRGFQGTEGSGTETIPWYTRPWIYQNLLELDRFYVTCYLDGLDPRQHRVYPERVNREDGWADALRGKPHLVMARIAIPALQGMVIKTSESQVRVDLARVALALERHRLGTGALPESLGSLVPRWIPDLPRDLITGAPLRYQTSGGSYRLYSVGWDTLDQGGVPAPKAEKGQLRPGQGDWVWFMQAQP